MKDKKQIEESENKLYKIIEMRDEIKDTISNIDELLRKTSNLIAILSDKADDKDIETLISGLDEEYNRYISQFEKLKSNMELLNQVIDECNSNKSVNDVVIKLLDALGFFQN